MLTIFNLNIESPSTLAKSTLAVKNSIYGTIPRNSIKQNSTISEAEDNMTDISGSVNEESGSVITSLPPKKIPISENILRTEKSKETTKLVILKFGNNLNRRFK